ncbi:LysR family transcriptional regulator [Candidatus Pantoea deserta]|uniref:LysR family transcriptional regulator n=1 Tax=Candidatus Pantoea deserta TaxID=1869313 RepID=A0A3N4PE80_9GAMM|nr:LysR family transcriptional regulator [Pantoea deserta]
MRAFPLLRRCARLKSLLAQSAVSRPLKYREEIWGVRLFQRGSPLSLTPAGAAQLSVSVNIDAYCNDEASLFIRACAVTITLYLAVL